MADEEKEPVVEEPVTNSQTNQLRSVSPVSDDLTRVIFI